MHSTKRFTLYALLAMVALCLPVCAQGQAVFGGTWRTDLSKTKFSPKPFIFYTSQGWFHCESCTPAFAVQADGQDHAVADQPFDTFNVAIVDPHTLHIVAKKDNKTAFDQTATVSADNKSLTTKNSYYPPSGGQPVTSEGMSKRDGALPDGVHATSGRWLDVKMNASENGLLTTYKVDGNQIAMSDSTGASFTAKLDGSDAPTKGMLGLDTVSLKLVNDHTIEETDKFNGKVASVDTMTVAGNGKTMTVVVTQKPSERVDTYVAVKK